MPGMTDPMNSLRLLQDAINGSQVSFQRCEIYPDIAVLHDTPNGTPRFTYAFLNGRKALSVALFVLTEPVQGVPCFQMGWATIESERGKGRATDVVSKGLAELINGMRRNGIEKFYIEAVIGEPNTESLRLASKIFSDEPAPCTDSFSGVSALQFLKAV